MGYLPNNIITAVCAELGPPQSHVTTALKGEATFPITTRPVAALLTTLRIFSLVSD